jgi:hypothetical protein
MNPKISQQAPEFSSSKVTEQSARSEAIIALGKKLVDELGLRSSVDTLGRWMAHYVAELLHEAEVATGDERLLKQTQLRDAILALWAHRHELHSGMRPFGTFEPIFRGLERLDPESKIPRHLSPLHAPRHVSGETEETMQWLKLAEEHDNTSKILIDYCVTSAAESALDKSQEWVALAEKAGVDDGFEFSMIRFLRDHSDLIKETDLSETQREILADRLEKLESFLSQASLLANDIKARLAQFQESAP